MRMVNNQSESQSSSSKVLTLDQVSSGGVAFRRTDNGLEVAIVLAKPKLRWQLPKGIVDPGESPEVTAVREVREEAGIEADLLDLIETIEYWYRSYRNGKPVRFHKFVHFFLLQYRSGEVSDHDHEVEEARWARIDEAVQMLAFKNEREVVKKAREMIAARGNEENEKTL